jgi:hypothetical protein
LDSLKGFNGIGGKKLGVRFDNWVVDLTFLPIFIAVFLVPSILVEEDSTKSFTLFSYWLVEKSLAWGSALLIWSLSAHIITKNGTRKVSILWIWLIGFLGGSFGCAVGEICKNWLGLTFRLEFYQRTVYTSITCICIVMVTSIAGRGRRSFIFFKNEVKRALIRQRIHEIQNNKSYLARFDKLQNEISSELNAVINLKSDQNDFKKLRVELRDFSHDLFTGLRHPKIRQLKSNQYFYSDFSYKLFLVSIRSEPLNPNIFTMILALFVCIPMLRIENSLKSLIASLFLILVTFIIHHAQNYYWKLKAPVKFTTLSFFDFLNLLILISGLSLLKSNFGFYKSVSNSSILLLMLVILYLFFYILGHISRVGDIAKNHQEVVRQDQISNTPSYSQLVEDEEYRIRMEWSKFIHSVLQGYLLVLDLSNKPFDRKVVLSELKIKILDFQKSVVFFGNPQILSLDDCFRNLDKKWHGILGIIASTESISKNTNISSQSILDLNDVLNELAVNAVKHGGADILRVEVKSRANNSLVVRVENNGTPLSKIKPGLGLSIFDLLCGESWSLKNYGGVVVFTCRIYSH